MIKLIASGKYKLAAAHNSSKILYLDSTAYIWRPVTPASQMLGLINGTPEADSFLAAGNYRLYEVKEEGGLTGRRHLELFLGNGRWQGYLLADGLPTDGQRLTSIQPTEELISARKLASL